MEKPPPYPAFTTKIRASTRMVSKILPLPFLIPPVKITIPVNAMDRMKISL